MAKSQVAKPQELAVQEKKELVSNEEKTVPARYYVQNTDIYEMAYASLTARKTA